MSDFDIRKKPTREFSEEADKEIGDMNERQDAYREFGSQRAHDLKMRLIGVALMFGGIVGMHYNYEYSGWAIFLGVMLLL